MTENHTAKWNEKSQEEKWKKIYKIIKMNDTWQKITRQNEMKKVKKRNGKNGKIHKVIKMDDTWQKITRQNEMKKWLILL